MNSHFIESPGVSLAWGRALQQLSRISRRELAPLTVAITLGESSETPIEHSEIRLALDHFLRAIGKPSVDTVANTIFPISLWNRELPRQTMFERYRGIAGRVRSVPQNRHGVYFERMIANGPEGSENQLEFALQAYTSRKGVRRSVLQVGVFDPSRDHTNAAMRGFPCLQHVSFVPDKSGFLSVNAFYASQYIVTRAYGNYLGLVRLGSFVAHELGLQLTRVTCHIGLAILDRDKGALREILPLVDAAIEEQRR